MGIEPFLFLAVFIGGFLLQASLAVREAVRRRLKARRWMRALVSRTGDLLGWRCDAEGWTGSVHGLTSTLVQGRRRQVLRAVEAWTGVRPAAHRLDGDTRMAIALDLPPGDRPRFTVTARGAAAVSAVPMGDVVLDQLVQVEADAPDLVRALFGSASVREPLLELLGRHPLSVVTDRQVVVWLSGTVLELQPTLDLAREVACSLGPREAVEDVPRLVRAHRCGSLWQEDRGQRGGRDRLSSAGDQHRS